MSEPNPDGSTVLTIGEMARTSGLTPRTLRFYEQRGLVPQTLRSDGGHRLYADDHVARIYQVQLLRGLGLSIDETAAALADPDADLASTIRTHLSDLDAQIAARTRLRSRLRRLSDAAAGGEPFGTEDLLMIIEEMNTMTTNINQRISILIYKDIDAAVPWLTETFGLGPTEITSGEDGVVHLATMEAGDGVLWLHPESPEFELVSPKTSGSRTAMMAVMVDDVDAHHAHAVEHGATIRYEPVDQPYGYREYGAIDCEGHIWSFMKALT